MRESGISVIRVAMTPSDHMGRCFANYWSEYGVVAYRWIQHDERRSKIHINEKYGKLVFEINAKLGQMGRTK